MKAIFGRFTFPSTQFNTMKTIAIFIQNEIKTKIIRLSKINLKVYRYTCRTLYLPENIFDFHTYFIKKNQELPQIWIYLFVNFEFSTKKTKGILKKIQQFDEFNHLTMIGPFIFLIFSFFKSTFYNDLRLCLYSTIKSRYRHQNSSNM